MVRKLFIISLTYINIITYFLKNVKFFFKGRQDFFLSHSTSILLLLKSFSFTLHIYYIIFFIKNQIKNFYVLNSNIRPHK
jgi:hypothetical protein